MLAFSCNSELQWSIKKPGTGYERSIIYLTRNYWKLGIEQNKIVETLLYFIFNIMNYI